MVKTHFFVALLCALICTLVSSQASAVQRAYVASYGSDANTTFNCDAANPCRFFQAATAVVDPNGEVVVVDSAGYGGVTITKSLSITAPAGVYAGISVFSPSVGITIDTPGVNVVLRGLTINGQGGVRGIEMTAGTSLSVENCVISNFSFGNGVRVRTAAKVKINNTLFRENDTGIYLDAGAMATIANATIIGSKGFGIFVFGTIADTLTTAAISNTTISGGSTGIRVESQHSTADVLASVNRSSITNGAWGIVVQRGQVAGTTLLTLSASTVTGNNVGLSVASALGGVIESSGNNTVRQNNFNIQSADQVITQVGKT